MSVSNQQLKLSRVKNTNFHVETIFYHDFVHFLLNL